MKTRITTFKFSIAALLALFNYSVYAQIPSCISKKGLVLYMPFNNNANDISGKNNHGTASNVKYVTDRLGNYNAAAYINRDLAAYVEVPNSASLNFGKGTYNFWINGNGTNCSFIERIDWADAHNGTIRVGGYADQLVYTVKYASNACAFGSGTNTSGTKVVPFLDLKWHMITLVYGDSQTYIYLDCKLIMKNEMNTIYADSCPSSLQIGRRCNADPQRYLGAIDDIGIWNRMLDTNEIKTIFNASGIQIINKNVTLRPGEKFTLKNKTYSLPGVYSDTVNVNGGGICARITYYKVSFMNVSNRFPVNGLAAHWPFNDSARDESGNRNHGKPSNVVYTTDRFGNPNGAFHFDPAKLSNIEIPNSPSLNSGAGNYNVWFRTPMGNLRCLMSKVNFTNPDNEVIHLYINSTQALGLVSYGNKSCRNGAWLANGSKNVNPNDSQWHMFTMVYGDSQTAIYFDGVFNNRIKTPGLRADSCGANIQIGRHRSDGPRYFYGDLDDISIWSRMLDSNEIKSLFFTYPLNIKNRVEKTIHIYPNPTHGKFTIATGDNEKYRVEVRDINGRILHFQNNVQSGSTVDFKGIAGIYIVNMYATDGKQYRARLVME